MMTEKSYALPTQDELIQMYEETNTLLYCHGYSGELEYRMDELTRLITNE